MQLEDWLDDLCVRFIVNLPPEELASVERICFQVEEAQWFYEDFVRPLDPSLPSLSLKQFSLRIFQHCPLFSQWSAQHHTTAFAEFLAYKQRVPVRGAIMLNDAMDEVLLVKGWKKGANWSFPRGKINKDENDLDCAVREVYEETGFDIGAAGLVKPEKEMKYIEVTMREQHMRLYVFRGVPKDTHFEPRTRKEISKIEWYKLTDLPTLRKKAHHEADDQPAINANKFYMVAPFLNPLKKWIAQQRKKEARYGGSSLAVPSVLAEESATENEGPSLIAVTRSNTLSPPALSSLPEVLPQSQVSFEDPSKHLKELLKIGGQTPQAEPVSHGLNSFPQANVSDVAKSNALLALLRNGSGATTESQTPRMGSEQISHPEQPFHAMRSPQARSNAHPQPFPSHPNQAQQQNLLHLFTSNSSLREQSSAPPHPQMQSTAPYPGTTDSQFPEGLQTSGHAPTIPPANALPILTHHTRNLLDAFRTQQPRADQASTAMTGLPPARQSLLDAFGSTNVPQNGHRAISPSSTSGPRELPKMQHLRSQPAQSMQTSTELPSNDQTTMSTLRREEIRQPAQANNLLHLFKQPSQPIGEYTRTVTPNQQLAPAELAAGPLNTPKAEAPPSQNEVLAALFRKDKPQPTQRPRSPVAKTGQTGATITGPLNQPQFENILKSPPSDSEARRSPVPSHRTLFNPKQPTPMKILARPEPKQMLPPPPRSPRATKTAAATSSPKKPVKVAERPFQPQILRRPQATESRQSLTPSPSSLAPGGSAQSSRRPSNLISSSPSPNFDYPPTMASPNIVSSPHRISEQSESSQRQKNTLLSLFGSQSPVPPSTATSQVTLKQGPTISASSITSPTFQPHSSIVSPITVDDPISTRSRVGSLASITSGGLGGGPGPAISSAISIEGRPKVEKRQTAAEDKAFLMGYLGRIASQEG